MESSKVAFALDFPIRNLGTSDPSLHQSLSFLYWKLLSVFLPTAIILAHTAIIFETNKQTSKLLYYFNKCQDSLSYCKNGKMSLDQVETLNPEENDFPESSN